MLTMARGTSGTLAYMSPQQLDGERASNLDDIYSLGATLYELLTSKPPFYSGGIERLIREKTPPSIAERRRDLEINSNQEIPAQWEQTIAACLAKDPTLRPDSASEVSARLQRAPVSTPVLPPVPLLPKQPLSAPAPARIESVPPIRPAWHLTSRAFLVAAAAALVIGGGALAWFLFYLMEDTTAPRTPEIAQVSAPSPVVTRTTAPAAPAPVMNSPAPVEAVAPVALSDPSPPPTPNAATERAEIETMVSTQIDAGTRGDVAGSVALYADNVDFLDEGLKTRDAIASDLPDYFAHWPVRRSTMVGEVSIENLSEKERKVEYTLDFEASNPATRESRQNRVDVSWVIRRDGPFSPFRIVSHKQKSIKPEKTTDPLETVKSYFLAVNNQDGTAAYRLFAAAFRGRVSFQEYLRRLKNTGTLTLTGINRTDAKNNAATVQVTFREVEPSGKVIQWQGPILLIVESGEWRIETLSKLNSRR
jgi:hypothetical protein